MHLEIVTPEASLVSGEVKSLTVPGVNGDNQKKVIEEVFRHQMVLPFILKYTLLQIVAHVRFSLFPFTNTWEMKSMTMMMMMMMIMMMMMMMMTIC